MLSCSLREYDEHNLDRYATELSHLGGGDGPTSGYIIVGDGPESRTIKAKQYTTTPNQ